MSAIVGVYHRAGRPVEQTDLRGMLARVAHRGPDGADLWQRDNVGLGHAMLHTTPESLREHLPLVRHDGAFVLTADARIDNRTELISLLRLDDRPGGAISDSDLILAAYEEWGEACPEKLLGDFAFAIWDSRKQILFCARDPFGVRSFYYYLSDATYIFATEIKAILSLAEVPRRLNEIRIADYLAGVPEDQASTFYRDILRLPAAHSLTVGPERTCVRRYWALDPRRELLLGSSEEYAEAFRAIFFEAVRCRLRSAFPVGSTLSGGLDSSSIACTARHLLSERKLSLHTFSAIFPGLPQHELQKIDERAYIAVVTAQDGIVPHFIQADRLSPLEEYDKVLWHMDEAFAAPNLYMHWALYGAARQADVRIFLDGIDGDTTVSHGLEFLPELARSGSWRRLFSEARALRRVAYPSKTPRRIVWQFALQPLIERWEEQARWKLHRPSRREQESTAILNPEFARRIRFAERYRMLECGATPPGYTARAAHLSSLSSGLLPYMLELADKSAAAFSLEPRYPFCDRRLVEFCLAIPPQQKLRRGWTRSVLRRAMTGVLPPQIQGRITKAMLGPNFYRNFIRFEQDTIESLIGDNAAIIQDYIDIAALQKSYRQHIEQPSEQAPAIAVYTATNLARWLRETGLHSSVQPAETGVHVRHQ